MAIIFYEGLPRSGKTYTAVDSWLIPAIKKKRPTYTNVRGFEGAHFIDYKEFAAPDGAVLTAWIDRIEDNALLVIDEAQTFWPNRAKLPPILSSFIAEHGHRGLTIVLISQSLRDLHVTWRRRVDQRIVVRSLAFLGLPSVAARITYKGMGDEKFEKTGFSFFRYSQKVFKKYKSETHEEIERDPALTKDAKFFSGWAFRGAAALSVVLLFLGGFYLKSYFKGGEVAPAPLVLKDERPLNQQVHRGGFDLVAGEAQDQVKIDHVEPMALSFVGEMSDSSRHVLFFDWNGVVYTGDELAGAGFKIVRRGAAAIFDVESPSGAGFFVTATNSARLRADSGGTNVTPVL